MSDFDLRKLSKKFNPEDIEWRVQQCGQGKNGPWAMIIPYIDNRAIMQRLDDVVGPGKWQNKFKSSPCGKGYLCGISIKIDDEWVTRWDGAELAESNNIDDIKSTLSSSMKRTGVQWGIGRYLYQFDSAFADVKVCDNRYDLLPGYSYQNSKDKKTKAFFGFQWKPKPLESWALPVTDKDISSMLKTFKEVSGLDQLRFHWEHAYKLATSENDDELMKTFLEAKEGAKTRIADDKTKKEDAHKEKLMTEVDNQISIINSGVNESVINGLKKVAIEKLKSMAKGENLKNAMTLINRASSEKLKSLRG